MLEREESWPLSSQQLAITSGHPHAGIYDRNRGVQSVSSGLIIITASLIVFTVKLHL